MSHPGSRLLAGTLVGFVSASTRWSLESAFGRPPASPLEADEFAERFHGLSAGPHLIDGMVFVSVTQCHPTKQNLIWRKLQMSRNKPVHTRPQYLRACINPISACGERHQIDISSEVGPLAGA